MKFLGFLLLAAAAITAVIVLSPGEVPAVPAVRAERGAIVSYLTTNGRVEAQDRYEVFVETAGRVAEVHTQPGAQVSRGALLLTIDGREARAELRQAEARREAARAELALLKQGGAPAEIAELEIQREQARRERERLLRETEILRRLVEKKAVPAVEWEQAQADLAAAGERVDLLRKKLEMRYSPEALEQARARLEEAEAQAALARQRVGAAAVRSPADGVVYSLAVEPGAYVSPGTLVARVGETARLRVKIFVDEPELGRIAPGQSARVTSDAFPGKSWECALDKLPTEVVEVGARRAGEARCTVDNHGGLLIPNLNVNVRVRTASAENALILPRQAVFRGDGQDRVWTAENGVARRRPVEIGIRSETHVEVRSGIEPGAEVLLPGAEALAEGQPVAVAAGG